MTEIKELREKSKQELEKNLTELRENVADLKIEHRTEGLLDTSELKKKRKEIARLMTVLREKSILAEIED